MQKTRIYGRRSREVERDPVRRRVMRAPLNFHFYARRRPFKETILSGSLTLADFPRCASLLATVQKFITFHRGKHLDRQPIQVTYENYADHKKREEGHKMAI